MPKHNVFNFNGIRLSMWFKGEMRPEGEYSFIISCHGLPSHPYQHNPAKMENVLDAGYVMVFPNYIGTWASEGVMSWENCVKTILETIKFIKSGKGKKVSHSENIKWKVKDITLLGGSFGGSVALVAGAKSDVEKIISVAGPTNYRDHSKIPEESAEPIEDLYYEVKEGWGNLWRVSKAEWDRLAKGECDLNPVDYKDVLKDKDTMLIHGKKDEVVAVKRAKQLHKELKKGKGNHKLMLLDEGHIGNHILGKKKVFSKVKEFLENQ